MAFSLAHASQSLPGSNAAVNVGAEMMEISTEVHYSWSTSFIAASRSNTHSNQALGFLSLAGESKVRLLPSPWPTDKLPPPTSSLFSITSIKGLVAAASPSAVVVATTESVRQAFSAGNSSEKVKPFTPQLTLPAPRLSQVCFTTDGKYLILSAEAGGGLAVYETQSLLQGNKEPAFSIATEGVGVRSIVPNPVADFADIVAVTLERGQLMMANLSERRFMPGQNGAVLKDGVSCVSWSNAGRNLVAGLGDGTAFQLEPSGVGKAVIPRPPAVDGGWHVSSILWLANNDFLLVHTPTNPSDPVDSAFHLAQTNADRSSFRFQKLPLDPAPPFGMNRLPPTHYFCRLRGWDNLLDALIISSVASPDVGLITKSNVPLTRDVDAAQITNTYTTTGFVNDSRRAQLPTSVNEDMAETSPVGMALDLSATEKAYKPIPGDEIDYSPIPLPAMMLLNHEGILSAWWFVYNDAVRGNKIYPRMVAAGGSVSSPTSVTNPSTQASGFAALSAPKLQAPAFGSSGFAAPKTTAFGQIGFGTQPAQTNTFGSSGFGSQSQMGAKASPWASGSTSQSSAPAFGQSAFGQPAALGKPAFGSATAFGASASSQGFGSAGALGQNKSPWGTVQSSTNDPSAKTSTPFGGAAATGQSGFGKLASSGQSGFAALGGATSSPFGQLKSSQPAFAATSTPGTSFVMSGMSTPQPSFGSTVTIDSKTDGSTIGSKSLFDGTPAQPTSFGKLSSWQAEQDDDAMADDGDELPTEEPQQQPQAQEQEQQKSTNGLFGAESGGFKLESSFKADDSSKDDPAQKELGKPLFGSDFAASLGNKQDAVESTPTKDQPAAGKLVFSLPAKNNDTTTASTPPKVTPIAIPPKQETPPKSHSLQPAEPPEVTSKPVSSPAPTASAPSSVEELPPMGSSPPIDSSPPGHAENIPAPDSDDGESQDESEDFEDESGEVSEGDEEETGEVEDTVDDAPLPPDPSKVKKPAWFYEAPPGAESSKPFPVPSAKPQQLKPVFSRQALPEAPSPPSTTESPLFGGKTTTTPAGFPKAPMTFQPPVVRESPRSPSPVRSASTPVGRAMAPPTLPQSPLRQPPTSRPIIRPALPSQPEEPTLTAADLTDIEDARIRALLAAPIQATTTLDPFIAYHSTTGPEDNTKMGLPAAIERVYRDINSMIDNLGLNARSITAFVRGHEEHGKDAGRERSDLEDPNSWVLGEIEALAGVQRQLESEVDNARVEDVDSSVAELAGMRRELLRWRREVQGARAALRTAADPAARKRARDAPLPHDAAALQRRLRDGLALLQTQIAVAEEAGLATRAKVAAARARTDAAAAPTVEAVEATVRKMTAMVQRRSTDVDVLEAQMRRVGLARESTPERPGSTRSSLLFGRGSALNTPSPGKAKAFEVPESDGGDDDGEDPLQREQRRAWERRVQAYKEKKARRKVALAGLREAVLQKAAAEAAAEAAGRDGALVS